MDINTREPKGHTFEQDELHIIDALTTARAHVGGGEVRLRDLLDKALWSRINAYTGTARAALFAFVASEVARKRYATNELLASAAAIIEDESNDDLYLALKDSAEVFTFQGGDDDDAQWAQWSDIWDEAVERHQEARKAAGITFISA